MSKESVSVDSSFTILVVVALVMVWWLAVMVSGNTRQVFLDTKFITALL